MFKVEINMQTGERKELPLTADDIQQAQETYATWLSETAQATAAFEKEVKRRDAVEAALAKMAEAADAPQAVKAYIESKDVRH